MLTATSCSRGGLLRFAQLLQQAVQAVDLADDDVRARIWPGSSRLARRSWAAPLMPPSGLRISCASPSATVPSAASRSARRVVVSSVLLQGEIVQDEDRAAAACPTRRGRERTRRSPGPRCPRTRRRSSACAGGTPSTSVARASSASQRVGGLVLARGARPVHADGLASAHGEQLLGRRVQLDRACR